jgi:hypothetical protein
LGAEVFEEQIAADAPKGRVFMPKIRPHGFYIDKIKSL